MLADRASYLLAAAEALADIIPADSVGWMEQGSSASAPEIRGSGVSTRPAIEEALRATLVQHPLAVSFRSHPAGLAPRRMSDVLSQRALRRTVVYQHVFVPMGDRFQLGVPLRSDAGGLTAWAFNRSGPDFSDAEVELALRLQPLLRMLDRLAGALPDEPAADADSHGLGTREVEVLRLLAAGLTAGQIAVALGISVRTVHKHLENMYVKLGVHDRLAAVHAGIRLGLVPEARRQSVR
ncbi:response regulator transcription factor [Rathayibacter sp. CAU 1779]